MYPLQVPVSFSLIISSSANCSQEAKAEGSQGSQQPGLNSKTLSKKMFTIKGSKCVKILESSLDIESSWAVIHFQPHSSTLSNEAHLSAAVFTAQSLKETVFLRPISRNGSSCFAKSNKQSPRAKKPPKKASKSWKERSDRGNVHQQTVQSN